MELGLSAINWLAVLVGVVAGQVISTVWFVVLFAQPWAEEYGVADAKQHTKDIPGYTYGIQALCTLLLTVGLAILQGAMGVSGAVDALLLGAVVSVAFIVPAIVPGQAFLKRWGVAKITVGSQVAMVLGISLVLGLWP